MNIRASEVCKIAKDIFVKISCFELRTPLLSLLSDSDSEYMVWSSYDA